MKLGKIKKSNSKIIRVFYSIIRFNWLILKFGINKKYRNYILDTFFPQKDHFQISNQTRLNRYPLIFQTSRDYLISQNKAQLKLLSFGCSTGEEVLSLASYMPDAHIVGVDINKRCIEICRRNNQNQQHLFYPYNSKEFENEKSFDAIFCMAVFQRTENRTRTNNSIAKGITFQRFESEISKLDSKLNEKGLLIIDHTDFDFRETKYALRYQFLDFDKNQKRHNRPLFNSKNEKVSDEQFLYRVFVKMS